MPEAAATRNCFRHSVITPAQHVERRHGRERTVGPDVLAKSGRGVTS